MPATIIVFLNGQEVKRYEIGKERIIIGRIPENDIVIDHPTVSRKHAAIVKMGEAYQLQDLGSSSGTYVNAKKIASYFLNDGDEVSIGQLVLRFNLPQPPQMGDSEMTMVVTNDDIKKQLAMMHQAALAGKPPAPAGQAPQPAQAIQPPPTTQPVAPPPATQPMAPPVMKPAPLPAPVPATATAAQALAAPPVAPVPVPVPAPPPAPSQAAPVPVPPPAPLAQTPAPAHVPAPNISGAGVPARQPEAPPAPLVKAAPPPPPKPPAPPPLPPSMTTPIPLPEPSLLNPAAPVLQAPKPAVHPLLSGQPKAAAPATPSAPPAPPKPAPVSPPTGESRPATDSALLATVKGPFLGGKALPQDGSKPPVMPSAPPPLPAAPAPMPPKPPAPLQQPAAPQKMPLPPTRPEFPPGSFEPTIISQGKPVPVTPPPHAAPGGAGVRSAELAASPARHPESAQQQQPAAFGAKPDLASADFDAGKTVPPMAIGGLKQATDSYPKSQMPADPASAPPPQHAPGVIPTPLPPTLGQTPAPKPAGSDQVPIDQLLQPLHSRPKTQPMPPPVPQQPAPHAAPPPVQPLQPVSPQQTAPTAASPAVRGGVGGPGTPGAIFAQAKAGGWGDMTPPIAPTDDDKQWGMLSVILSLFCWIGVILGFVLRPQSKFVKFYCMQMIFLFLASMVLWVAAIAAYFILMWISAILVLILNIGFLMLSIAFLVLLVIMALKANKGILYKLPLIGGYAYNMSYGK